MPRSEGPTGQKHYRCADCGSWYPVGRMTKQAGLWRCDEGCLDIRDHAGEVTDEDGVHPGEIKLPDPFEPWW